METLLWVAGFAALMYFMHRMGIGCCGGHHHGHGDHASEHKEHADGPPPGGMHPESNGNKGKIETDRRPAAVLEEDR